MTNPYAPPVASVRDIAEPRVTAAPAERGTRLAASFLDAIIFVLIVYVPMIFVALISGPTDEEAVDLNSIVLMLAGFAVWCWFTIRRMSANGQSIAKKFLGIKVVRSDGSPVSLGRLIGLRNVVNGLISIVPLYTIVDTLFIFGEAQQCLHDKIADTIVVKA